MNPAMIRWRAHLALGSMVLVIALIGLSVLAALWRSYADANDALGALEPRYARLAGLARSEERLRATLAEVERRVSVLAIPKEVESLRAGADLQRKARESAESAGLQVAASQIFPARMEDELERIWISLTLKGGLDQVRAFLLALAMQTPRVHVSMLTIQPDNRRLRGRSGQDVQVSLEISQFRVPR